MTRKSDSPRATRANHGAASTCADRLHFPDGWDDGSPRLIGVEAANDGPDTYDDGGDDDALAQRRLAMRMAGPPNLVKAMLALDWAKSDDDICAARAILRVTGF